MKKIIFYFMILSTLLIFNSCRDDNVIIIEESQGVIRVNNTGDIDIQLTIEVLDSIETGLIERGTFAEYDIQWEGSGSVRVYLEAEELETGDIQSETIYLNNGTMEIWDVGWELLYEADTLNLKNLNAKSKRRREIIKK